MFTIVHRVTHASVVKLLNTMSTLFKKKKYRSTIFIVLKFDNMNTFSLQRNENMKGQ